MEIYDFTERINNIIQAGTRKPKKTTPKCFICGDKGILTYRKQIGELSYLYVCHCICDMGKPYIYEGRYCKDKTNYRVPTVEEIMSSEAIKNLEEHNKSKWL